MNIEIICNERGTGKTEFALLKYQPCLYFTLGNMEDDKNWNNTQEFYCIIDSIESIPVPVFSDVINRILSVEWEAIILIFDIKKSELAKCPNFNLLYDAGRIPIHYKFKDFVVKKEVFYNYLEEYFPNLKREDYDRVIRFTNSNFNQLRRLALLNELNDNDEKGISPQALSQYIDEIIAKIYKDIPNAETLLQMASIIGEQFSCEALESYDGFQYDAASAYIKRMNDIHGLIQKCMASKLDYKFISHDVYESIFDNIQCEKKIEWIKRLIQYYNIQYKQCIDVPDRITVLNHLNILYKFLPSQNEKHKEICFILLYQYRSANETMYALAVAQEIIDEFSSILTGTERAFIQNYQINTFFQLWEYQKALEILKTINNSSKYVGSRMLIKYYYAYCLYQTGDVDESYDIAQELIEYLKNSSGSIQPSHKLFCMTYSLMATLQNHLDKEDNGLGYYGLALKHASKEEKGKDYYDILKKCDMFYCYEDIKISLGECLQFYDKKNDGYSAGEIYVNLATEMMFQDCGEKNKIKEYFERAICYLAENSSKKLVYAKNNYAIYLIMVEKNITKGLNYLKEVLLVGLSDFTYMCLYLNICMCYILLGKTEDADFTDSYQRFHLAKKRLNKRRNATKYEDVYEDILNIIIAEQQGENVEKLCLTALGKLDNNSFFVPLLDDIVKRNCRKGNSVYKENANFYKTMNEMRCFLAEFRFWE